MQRPLVSIRCSIQCLPGSSGENGKCHRRENARKPCFKPTGGVVHLKHTPGILVPHNAPAYRPAAPHHNCARLTIVCAASAIVSSEQYS